jgi:putative membrane protein
MRESRETLYRAVPVTDGLAAERTFLAAERTLLAYLRTALAMSVAGLTGARLLDDPVLRLVSVALAAASLVVLAFGIVRHRRSDRVTRQLLRRY